MIKLSPPKAMELPMVLLRFSDWFLYQFLANSCHRAATKVKNHGFFRKTPFLRQPAPPPLYPSFSKCELQGRESQTLLVCDFNRCLLRTDPSFFPYFMLVAFEGGSILRALLLLLSWPFLCILGDELRMRAMIFVTFCGLRCRDMESVSKAVLPKFYLENMNADVFGLLKSTGSKVVCTSVPRVMVEGFLEEYLGVDRVIGTELHRLGKFYTGLVSKNRDVKEVFGGKRPDLGVGTSKLDDLFMLSLCQEAYLISKEDSKNNPSSVMARNKYPKPLIFHDGRLAFLPTPLATLHMFTWLPVGVVLAIFRTFIGIFLPYKLALNLGTSTGIILTTKGCAPRKSETGKGVLYVCSHRTLLDPVFLSTSLGKSLTAVTYSLSRASEILAPIRTARLTRDRKKDGETMEKLLGEGDLVVCPEGTTCREPYLLRFSSLFAELADEIVPVAVNTNVTMFYGTTASGLKCLDPFFFLMNPRPSYSLHILEKVPKELTCAGGKSSHEVANYIQNQLADALGFECTNLTRRDKYLMLAGNEGVVEDKIRKFI